MKKNTKSALKRILGTSLYFFAILLAAYLINNYVVKRASVIGVSMEDTLFDGQQLLMDQISYKVGKPERFDIVVFTQKYTVNTHLIKRVIGLPGERIYIDKDGVIYINGEVLQESYGLGKIEKAGRASHEIILLDDQYFVLGDNRNESIDSRSDEVGNVNIKDIEGKVILRIYPFDRFGVIK